MARLHPAADSPNFPSSTPHAWRRIGPGILMAGAAIGVSHLVQATRAGAAFGTQLILLVVLIHLIKYPFFEYGHRYAAATGESLLHGYARLGRGFLFAFIGLVAVSGVITVAGVTFITAGLAQNLSGTLPPIAWAAILLAACAALLGVGHYRLLDLSMRVIVVVLMLATLTAVAALIAGGQQIAVPGGVDFADSAGGFASQFVQLYVQTLGPWAAPIVATAALATMFSTLLAILDAYPRSLTVGAGLVRGRTGVYEGATYWVTLGCMSIAAMIIIQAFLGSLRNLIDLATTMAFLSAPLLGWLNFRLLTSTHTPAEARPGRAMRVLSWIGIVFFIGLGALYLVQRFVPAARLT